MPVILSVAGLLLACVEIWATRWNRRWLRTLTPRKQSALSAGAYGVGGALVYLSMFGQYSLPPNLKVFGIPFPTSVWEYSQGHWLDFTGPLTLPAMLGNGVAAFLLPQVLLSIGRYLLTAPVRPNVSLP